jgi:ParB/RepB/Spo0J family partition protein
MENVESIELWPLAKILPNPHNPRKHPRKQIDSIVKSMEVFGFNNPILVRENGSIVAGHGRLEAAKRLDLPEAPVIVLDHLTEAEARAYLIADNKTQEASAWDEGLLAQNIKLLAEDEGATLALEAMGFAQREVDAMVGDMGDYGKPDLADAEALGDEVKPMGDGNWFYCEMYGMDAEFKTLQERMGPFMVTTHEIRRDHFVEMIEMWLEAHPPEDADGEA